MAKTFAQAPKPQPQPLSAEAIVAFERGGPGQDRGTHIPPNVELVEPTNVATREHPEGGKGESTRRLSIDLPASLHRRFKTACSKTDKKMLREVMDFIEWRTVELEKE
jgi:hypothetical protein